MKTVSGILAADRGFITNAKSVSLSEINFSIAEIQEVDELIRRLRLNSNLQYLDLSGCRLFSYDEILLKKLFQCIREMQTLEVINLTNNFPASPESVWAFNLTSPFLGQNILSIQLDSNAVFTYESDSNDLFEDLLTNHPGLQKISISYNCLGLLSESGLDRFGNALQSSQLKILDLSGNQFEQLSLSSFEKLFGDLGAMGGLRELNLSANNFSGKPLQVLCNFLERSLAEEVYFNACYLGFMAIEAADLKTLIQVICGRNVIRKLGVNANHLDVLSLTTGEEGDDAVESFNFLEMNLSQWTVLERLDLSNNMLYHYKHALKLLAKALLLKNPIKSHAGFRNTRIFRDFANTGYEDELEMLAQETLQQGTNPVLFRPLEVRDSRVCYHIVEPTLKPNFK